MTTDQAMKELLIDLNELFYFEESDKNIISFKASHPLARRLAHMVSDIKNQEGTVDCYHRQRNVVYDRP